MYIYIYMSFLCVFVLCVERLLLASYCSVDSSSQNEYGVPNCVWETCVCSVVVVQCFWLYWCCCRTDFTISIHNTIQIHAHYAPIQTYTEELFNIAPHFSKIERSSSNSTTSVYVCVHFISVLLFAQKGSKL